HRDGLMANPADLRPPATARKRPPGRNAPDLQHGTGNAAGRPVEKVQESSDSPRARGRKSVHRRPDCEGRPQSDVYLIRQLGAELPLYVVAGGSPAAFLALTGGHRGRVARGHTIS